jgi:primosomal protein N' (replication factor Y) (superfamily II helicase)
LGIVWAQLDAPPAELAAAQIKTISAHFDAIAPLDLAWRRLVDFAARYYQRSVGEVALAALPPQLRDLKMEQMAKRLKKRAKAAAHTVVVDANKNVALNDQQTMTLAKFSTNTLPTLLFGATGSGKTEVYLHAAQSLLENDPLAQVLVMVPEINLTPQLEARFSERFGAASVVAMHSGMTPAQRLQSWLAAHIGVVGEGGARIVLGTRMAVLASIPNLRLIIVDEEHDPSYKAQDGARHSARDLAVYRAKLHTDAGQPCQVMLGSATPSLESWQACEKGRYARLDMPLRVGGGALAQVKLVDMRLQPPKTLFAPALLDAISQRVARGEQCLVFLNRRGYSPVLACDACGWKSECPHCSAYRVFHKIDRTLRCHHCGLTEKVPRACPECGNIPSAVWRAAPRRQPTGDCPHGCRHHAAQRRARRAAGPCAQRQC